MVGRLTKAQTPSFTEDFKFDAADKRLIDPENYKGTKDACMARAMNSINWKQYKNFEDGYKAYSRNRLQRCHSGQ